MSPHFIVCSCFKYMCACAYMCKYIYVYTWAHMPHTPNQSCTSTHLCVTTHPLRKATIEDQASCLLLRSVNTPGFATNKNKWLLSPRAKVSRSPVANLCEVTTFPYAVFLCLNLQPPCPRRTFLQRLPIGPRIYFLLSPSVFFPKLFNHIAGNSSVKKSTLFWFKTTVYSICLNLVFFW